MDSLPSAVFVSCTRKHPDEIIKLILNEDEIDEPKLIGENIKAYAWSINTKYYNTDIYLCSMMTKSLESQEFASSVEAVIINFDSNTASGLEVVESWIPFTKEFEPEINILLCDRCAEEGSQGISKIAAQEWCVKNGFELVELDPYVVSEDEEYELDFQETTGIKRVIQALHAHIWPNLILKEGSQQLSKAMQSLLNGEASCENTLEEDPLVGTLAGSLSKVDLNNGISSGSSFVNGHHSAPEDTIDRIVYQPLEMEADELPDSYGNLLENLHDMKERVQSLPSEQRKAAAEKVVMAFWRALGGEEDEIAGLSDSEET